MTEADRQYCEAMDRLFQTPEWKLFATDIEGWMEAIASQWRTLRPEQLAFEQGRHAGLEQVVTHCKLLDQLREKDAEDAVILDDAA